MRSEWGDGELSFDKGDSNVQIEFFVESFKAGTKVIHVLPMNLKGSIH